MGLVWFAHGTRAHGVRNSLFVQAQRHSFLDPSSLPLVGSAPDAFAPCTRIVPD